MLDEKYMQSHSAKKLICHTIVWAIIVIILYIICYYEISQSLSLWINLHLKDGVLAKSSQFLSTFFGPHHWEILLAVSLLISIFYRMKQKLYLAKPWLLIFFSLFISSVVAFILKVVLARARPELLFQHHIYGFEWFSLQYKYQSTPSGHAVLAFAGLLSLACILKKPIYYYIAAILAALVSCSRIIVLDHYLGDVIVGAYIGVFSYLWSRYIVTKIDQRLISKKS